MAATTKQVIAIVSDRSGNIIKTWADVGLRSFDKQLDGGLGECVIALAREFDYSAADLQEGNDVEIRVSDRETMADLQENLAKTVYRGYISMIERSAEGNGEGIIVHLLGYYTLLGTDILKNGVQTTLYSNAAAGLTTVVGSIGAADIGLMMRAVILRYIAETVGPKMAYNAEDIPDAGITAEYTFEQKTYREAIDKIASMAAAGVRWYVGADGRFKFKGTPTTPTHTFALGRNIKKIYIERGMEKVRNFVLIWNGETGGSAIYNHYQDDTSIARYGRRAAAIVDKGIGDAAAANYIGAKFLADNKNASVRLVCEIEDSNGDADRGYDIEKIEPGDTCMFTGFDPGLADVLPYNMTITKVVYKVDSVEIEVEIAKSGILELQQKAIDDLSAAVTSGVPPTYS